MCRVGLRISCVKCERLRGVQVVVQVVPVDSDSESLIFIKKVPSLRVHSSHHMNVLYIFDYTGKPIIYNYSNYRLPITPR